MESITDSSQDAIVEIRNVDVSFQMERGSARVVDDVSMDIFRKETLGIVGESGSGKSMFASSLLDAVVKPGQLSGDVRLYPEGDDPVSILELSESELKAVRWETIAMVFQGAMSSFNPVTDFRTHFEETLRAHDHDVSEGMERARELLADLHLEDERILDSYPHEVSGGQKQRILIALSLLLQPEILILDEPTSALDLLMQRLIINLLYEIKEKYDITLVFISHDLPLVAGFADRLGVMYAFQFVEVGPANKILTDAAHPYTRSLLKATPSLDSPFEDMTPIPGESPDPVDVPSGCSYRVRCPLADEECELNDPDLREAGTDHSVACFYWEDASDAIPLSLGSDGE